MTSGALRTFVFPAVVFLLSLAVFFTMVNHVFSLGGLALSVDANTVRVQARHLADTLGIQRTGRIEIIRLEKDDRLIRALQDAHGMAGANMLLRNDVPGYYWDIRWSKEGTTGNISLGGNRKNQNEPAVPEPHAGLRLDTHGRLLGFAWDLPDSLRDALPVDSAHALAAGFLARHVRGIARLTPQPRRPHPGGALEFGWEGTDTIAGIPSVVTVGLTGNAVSLFRISPTLPEDPSPSALSIAGTVIDVSALLLVAALMLVVGIRRIRSYEIDLMRGLIAGSIAAILLGFRLYLDAGGGPWWSVAIIVVIPSLFTGALLAFIWSVAESVGREQWKDTFLSFDLLLKGHLRHSALGSSIVRGLALGAVGAVVWAACAWAASWLPGFAVPANGDLLSSFESSVPAFPMLSGSIFSTLFRFAVFVLFVTSIIRQRTGKFWKVLIGAAIVAGAFNHRDLQPVPAGILVETITVALFVWGFSRFGLVATFLGMLVSSVLFAATPLMAAAPTVAFGSDVVLGGLAIALFGWGSIAIVTRDAAVNPDDIAPAFAVHISERERLQREIEIARDVQMSFLPRTTPSVPGLDIASLCVPAQEVGGDYYDFIGLEGGRLGVVVGDVSGKGTQAAFYMTLTKGFWKAVSRSSDSPAEVLTRLNDLFFENVERGTFISMVYGIFDPEAHSAIFARAGHNPVIVRKQGTGMELVRPQGIALGLDRRDVFSRAIHETAVPFARGDIFTLYTDGLTEARNRQGDEYGEDRFREVIARAAELPATGILQASLADVKEFSRRTEQHDDMTIVVVKITR